MVTYNLTKTQLDRLQLILELTETAVLIDSTLLGYNAQETLQIDRALVKRRLTNTAPGAVPHALLNAMLVCVFKIETFGTEGVQLRKPFQFYRNIEELLEAALT